MWLGPRRRSAVPARRRQRGDLLTRDSAARAVSALASTTSLSRAVQADTSAVPIMLPPTTPTLCTDICLSWYCVLLIRYAVPAGFDKNRHNHPMPTPTARERLVSAAFNLFARQSFDATTVDQIATEAGVGRTTFFRNFPTKEDVVLPQHGPILSAVDARL